MRHLAESLFIDPVRNRLMMGAWLGEPLPMAAGDRLLMTRSAITFEEASREREARRQATRRRALVSRSGGMAAANARQEQRLHRALVPAATAAMNRRQPRQATRVQSVVAAMASSRKRRRDASGQSSADGCDGRNQSLVEQVAAFFRY